MEGKIKTGGGGKELQTEGKWKRGKNRERKERMKEENKELVKSVEMKLRYEKKRKVKENGRTETEKRDKN